MKNIEILEKYLENSKSGMSAYGKHHIYNSNFKDIEKSMNSGTFIKLNRVRILKYYLSIVFQLLLFGKEVLFNEFIKRYKSLCKTQMRMFNQELIYHSIFLNLLKKRNILKKKVCVIGDGKANFVNGVLNLADVNKIFSINLPQSLIQDYIILTKFNSIDKKFIKIVEHKEDLKNDKCKIFLIPAQNKEMLINQNIDLFVNSFGFQEMPIEETHSYIDIAQSNGSYLYSLNREEKKMYDNTIIKYKDYGLNKKGTIIFENEANFVKYKYDGKFPFIHKKKSKYIHSLIKFDEKNFTL
tara:strand:- start:521 stop:1411 length:891 start_codon:yes stop_codon:yes gene_type:complete